MWFQGDFIKTLNGEKYIFNSWNVSAKIYVQEGNSPE